MLRQSTSFLELACNLCPGVPPSVKAQRVGIRLQLQGLHVLGLQAFRAFYDLELHCLAFLQALEAACLNRGEVDEYVLSIGPADKAVALRVVKPLHCSLFHLDSTLFLVNFLLRRLAATVRWRRRVYRRVQPKMGQIKLSLISMRCGWLRIGFFYFQDLTGKPE